MSKPIDGEASGAPGRLVLPAGVSLSNTLMSPLKEKTVYMYDPIDYLITVSKCVVSMLFLVSSLLILELILLNIITSLYILL